MVEDNTCCSDTIAGLPVSLFKALADPNRIAILTRLSSMMSEQTVTDISACCPVNISVVSRHLKTLKDAGVLTSSKKGKEVYYKLDTNKIVKSLRELADAFETCCPDGTCVVAKGDEQ